MIEIRPESQGNILVLKATGKLTRRDYKEVLIPRLESIIHEHGKARLLLDMGDEFQGWKAMALWDDIHFGLKHRSDFEKMGVIAAPRWVGWMLKLGSVLISGELRTFSPTDRAAAVAWIEA
jgi:hypothetical protein